MLAVDVGDPSASTPIQSGLWRFTCVQDTTDPIDFHAYLTLDDGASAAIHFPNFSESHTIISPALSDSCIAVGAYQAQFQDPYGPVVEVGEMAFYSSGGPRIDGGLSVDLVAPVDPIAPTGRLELGLNAYAVGYGTSASSPVAAAVAGLIKAADPSLTPAEIREMLMASAEPLSDGPLPDIYSGFGQLRGYQALTGQEPPPRPDVAQIGIEVEFEPTSEGCRATAAVTDSDWDDASYRFDFEYDGQWDVDFGAERSASWVVPANTELLSIRADAAQQGWIVAGVAREIEVPETCVSTEPGTGTEGDESGGDGSETGAGTSGPGSDDESGSGPDQSEDDGGCGCQSPGSGFASAWLVPLMIGLRRRRLRIR